MFQEAGERERGLRRCHVVSQVLLDVFVGEPAEVPDVVVNFWLTLPDSRAMVALAVMFVPSESIASREPSDPAYNDMFAEGAQGLNVRGRVRAGAETVRMIPVDLVFGSPTTPVALPGDTYGWLVSMRPDAEEWHGQLSFSQESAAAIVAGKWLAVATFTDDTGGMTDEEWRRLVERVSLRGSRGSIELIEFTPG